MLSVRFEDENLSSGTGQSACSKLAALSAYTLFRALQIQPSQQRLCFGGRELRQPKAGEKQSLTLADYDVQPNSTLVLLFRLRGPALPWHLAFMDLCEILSDSTPPSQELHSSVSK